MKKIVVALFLVAMSAVSGAFVWRGARGQAINMKISVKDLHEHGVRIISPTDPSFDRRAQAFVNSESQETIQTIKAFAVIVENTRNIAIVGTRLNWEIIKLNGTIINMPVGSANPRALMDRGESKGVHTAGGAAIGPHSTRFISLIGSAGEGEKVDARSSWLSFRGSRSEMEEFNAAVARGERDEAFNKSVIGKLLREARSVTVSIDGVFFEDGTFVGEDKTGFFEEIKAYVDAEYDLATEISVANKQGKTPNDIFEQVRDFLLAHTRTNEKTPLSDNNAGARTVTDHEITALASVKFSSEPYENYKTLLAQQLMMRKTARGARQVIAEVLKFLETPRIPLIKK